MLFLKQTNTTFCIVKLNFFLSFVHILGLFCVYMYKLMLNYIYQWTGLKRIKELKFKHMAIFSKKTNTYEFDWRVQINVFYLNAFIHQVIYYNNRYKVSEIFTNSCFKDPIYALFDCSTSEKKSATIGLSLILRFTPLPNLSKVFLKLMTFNRFLICC